MTSLSAGKPSYLSVQTTRHPRAPSLEYHYLCDPRCRCWDRTPEHVLVRSRDRHARMTPFLVPKASITEFYRPFDRWCKFSMGKIQEPGGVMVVGDLETMTAINDTIKHLYDAHDFGSSFGSGRGFARDVHETTLLRCDHILEDITTVAGRFKCHRHDGETLNHSPDCTPKIGWSLIECSKTLSRFSGMYVLVVLERTIGHPSYPNNNFNIPFGKWQPRITPFGRFMPETPIQTALRELNEEAMFCISELESQDWRKKFDEHAGVCFTPNGRVFNGMIIPPIDDRHTVTIEHGDDPIKVGISLTTSC